MHNKDLAQNAKRLAILLDVQQSQLEEWKSKLNPACYKDLAAYVDRCNAELLVSCDPDISVARGSTLDNFVHNWSPETE